MSVVLVPEDYWEMELIVSKIPVWLIPAILAWIVSQVYKLMS